MNDRFSNEAVANMDREQMAQAIHDLVIVGFRKRQKSESENVSNSSEVRSNAA